MNEKYNWNFKTSYELLPEVFYKKVSPNTVKSPEIVIFNEELANELGLDSSINQEGRLVCNKNTRMIKQT